MCAGQWRLLADSGGHPWACPVPSLGQGCRPQLVRLQPCRMCYWEQPANPQSTLMESLMESGSKVAETYMQVSSAKQSISLKRKIRDLTPRILRCKPLSIRLCFLRNKYSNLFDRCVASA